VATSALFFHEAVSVRRAAGVAVIVLGMVLMNRKSRKNLA
jgi:multidrug transporter EmrE-like cation transporter